MNNPTYTIERWPLGWVICAVPGLPGIPMDALSECMPLFPPGAVMDCGIIHHLRQTGHYKAMVCVVAPANGDRWRTELEAAAPARQAEILREIASA